jgi:hypothetical protein
MATWSGENPREQKIYGRKANAEISQMLTDFKLAFGTKLIERATQRELSRDEALQELGIPAVRKTHQQKTEGTFELTPLFREAIMQVVARQTGNRPKAVFASFKRPEVQDYIAKAVLGENSQK